MYVDATGSHTRGVRATIDGVHRPLAVLYWLLLIAWFAGLVASAATAMAAFGSLPRVFDDLGISVPQIDAMQQMGALQRDGNIPERGESGRYIAGFVAQRVFDAVETLQWIIVPMMIGTLLLQRFDRWPARSTANTWRRLLLVAAICCTGYHLIVLGPRMRSALSDYRGAVQASDAISAASHKAGFDRDHKIADPLLRTTSFLLLGTIVLSAWTLTPRIKPPGDRYLGSR